MAIGDAFASRNRWKRQPAELATPLAREAFEFARKKQPNDWQRFRAESLLGVSLAGQKKLSFAKNRSRQVGGGVARK